jgi:hypothetical protein
MDWFHLMYNIYHQHDHVNTVMNIMSHKCWRIFWPQERLLAFKEGLRSLESTLLTCMNDA